VLAAWCSEHLGAEPDVELSRSGYLSLVLTLRLAGGRECIVKAREPQERLHACCDVQRHLWRQGYPCPRLLAGPSLLQGLLVTAEAPLAGGGPLPPATDGPRLCAAALAEQVRLCRGLRLQSTLEPAPPWLGWEHDGEGVWPAPDDLDLDLNAYAEPAWLTDLARQLRARLLASRLPRVIGHADWHQGNLRWLDGRLHAVYDWDSVAVLPEAAIAGGASVLFSRDSRAESSLTDSDAFLRAYALARGEGWSGEEWQVAWAAGLWNLAFDAKKQTLDGVGRSREVLEAECARRLALAGI
jgi:hypothetical protein